MVGYAVCAVGVVVYQAEVVGRAGEDFRKAAEVVEGLREGPRSADTGFVTVWRDGFVGLGVE